MHEHFWGFHKDRDCRFAGRGRRGEGSAEATPGASGGKDADLGGWGKHERGPGSYGFGPFGGGPGGGGPFGFGRGFGGRGFGRRGFGGPEMQGGRGRMFDAGDIRLVILKLLSEQPSYGYQLIKTMEQSLGGGYTPSAGVIYPTLTQLEEEGLAASTLENNKKVYSLTPEGVEHMESNKERIGELFSRLEETGRGFERGRSPELMKAFMNLRSAVVARVSRGNMRPDQLARIAEAIDAAAKTIDEL